MYRPGRGVWAACAAGLALLLPLPAHAFPVVEGAGALSSLLASLSAMLAGSTLSLPARRKARRRGILLAILAIAAGIVLAFYAAIQARDDVNIARQSRPLLNLPDALAQRSAIDQTHAPDALRDAIARDLFIDPGMYRQGAYATHARIYVNHDADAQRHQPTPRTALPAAPGDTDRIRDLWRAHDGRVILVSEDAGRLAQLAFEMPDPPRLLWLGDPAFQATSPLEAARQVPASADAFTLPVVDIRQPRVIRETHTLHNAKRLPLADILLMTDAELMRWLRAHDPVFTGYDDTLHDRLAARLSELPSDAPWRVLDGGLEAHFFDAGRGITPDYPTKRLISPKRLMTLYMETGRVTFLCTTRNTCPDTLPAHATRRVTFRDKDRDDRISALADLPRDRLYVAISNDQETAGNALLAGWWLTRSGHDYIGEFPLPGRFSLEEIRARARADGHTSLAPYRSSDRPEARLRDALETAAQSLGWAWTMLLAGALLRIALLPVHLAAIRPLYDGTARHGPATLASLAVLGAMVTAFLWLDRALLDHAVIGFDFYAQPIRAALFDPLSPDTATGLSPSGGFEANRTTLAAALAAALLVQAALSFPTRPAHLCAIAGLVAGLWLSGLISRIEAPLLLFLLGSECAVLAVQALPAARARRAANQHRAGYYRTLPVAAHPPLPEKFALTSMVAGHQPGVLTRLDATPPAERARRLLRIDKSLARADRLIVRSASSARCESARGGWYASPCIDATEHALADAIEAQRAAGLSHVWVQPYLPARLRGTIASIDTAARRGVAHLAPEGHAPGSTQAIILDTPAARMTHSRLWRALRRAERRLDGPVHLEVSIGRGLVIHQARRLTPETAPEALLWPDGHRALRLAADLVAQPCRLTGEVLEQATRDRALYLRGYLYWRRTRPAMRGIWRTRRLRDLEGRLAALSNPQNDALSIPEIQARLRHILDRTQEIWRLTQARGAPARVVATLEIRTNGALDAALAPPSTPAFLPATAPRDADRRDYLHAMLSACLGLFAQAAARIESDPARRRSSGLAELIGPPFAARRDLRDPSPVTEPPSGAIVPGPVRGVPWPSTAPAPPDDPAAHVLVGMEIGPEWVRDIPRFAGCVAHFGHSDSHVGLTARETGTPYYLVSAETIARLLAMPLIVEPPALSDTAD